MKTLEFTLSPAVYERLTGERARGRAVALLKVNLDELSPPARRLAEGVATLDNSDDFSDVIIRSKLTNADLVRRDWDMADYWRRPFEKLADTPEGHIAKVDNFYGYPWSEERQTIVWRWDPLGDGETPEEYFERQATSILEIGFIDRCALEPSWMTPTEAHDWATKWGYDIPHITLRKAMEAGNIAKARQDERRRWQAPIGAVIQYLENRPKPGPASKKAQSSDA